MGRGLSFRTLSSLEPRLLELEHDVRAVRDDPDAPSFCPHRLWYAEGGFKERVSFLVGWNAGITKEAEQAAIAAVVGPPVPGKRPFLTLEEIMRIERPSRPDHLDARLTTQEAYDTAYEYLYNLLPGCRNCLCV